MLDTKALAAAMAPVIRETVEAATAPLLKRIAELEQREIPTPPPGKDGASVTVDDVAPMIRDEVAKAVSALPTPKDGEPGRDGVDADLEAIRQAIDEAVQKAVAALPVPQNGKDGAPGRDGADGVGLAGAVIDRGGELILTLTNGETKALGAVVGLDGKDGLPGKDGERGADGFGLEDFTLEAKDDRTLVLKFTRGDVEKVHELAVPTMIYRGVFKEGEGYVRGDTVTWGGSLWHCDGDTTEKPGDGAKAWTLAAKRGRDGKDGKPGERGEKGIPGAPGRDLTQLGPDGAKW